MASVHTSHSSVQLQNFVDKPPITNLFFCGGISPSKQMLYIHIPRYSFNLQADTPET